MIDFQLLFLVTLKKHLMLIFRLQYKRVVVKREELLVHPPQKSTCLKKKKLKQPVARKGKIKIVGFGAVGLLLKYDLAAVNGERHF